MWGSLGAARGQHRGQGVPHKAAHSQHVPPFTLGNHVFPRRFSHSRWMGTHGSLAGLFFVEFHTQYGRTLAFQQPCVLLSDVFDAISDYLIPKPALCGQLIVIREVDGTVLCRPMCLENAKYDRNALLFSLGMVVKPTDDGNFPNPGCGGSGMGAGTITMDVCERYGPVLRKACGHLAALERETGLLSGAWHKDELARLLPQILCGLQEQGRCTVAVDAANTIQLLFPGCRPHTRDIPVEVDSCPVLLSTPPIAEVRRWDLTLQRLLRWIDGTRHTVDLALVACVDLTLVIQALQALQASGWVRMLDHFHLDNCYACLPALHRLANDPVARDQLVAAVVRPTAAATLSVFDDACSTNRVRGAARCRISESGDTSSIGTGRGAGGTSHPSPSPPDCTWFDVLRLYAAFRPSTDGTGRHSVRDVCRLHVAAASKVDARRLVHAGLLNGLLQRVHEEPINATPTLMPLIDPASDAADACGASPLVATMVPTLGIAAQPAARTGAELVRQGNNVDYSGGGSSGGGSSGGGSSGVGAALPPSIERIPTSSPSRTPVRFSKVQTLLERSGAGKGGARSCTLDGLCTSLSLSADDVRLVVHDVWPGCVWIQR